MRALLMKREEDQLIHEKVAVPDALPRVSRPRLLKLLTGTLVSCNATIINGRAGTARRLWPRILCVMRGGRPPGTR